MYEALGEGTAADWKGISTWLALRAGTQPHHPAWLQYGGDSEESYAYLCDRFRLACCSGEVAVLMLRLVVHTASLHSSWYGPWDSLEALQQLVKADAWSSLLHAQRALLGTFGSSWPSSTMPTTSCATSSM